MDIRIYVGGLARTTTAEDLRVLFAQAGKVISVELVRDAQSGISSGFAFITMSSQRDAIKAITMFNNYPLAENNLRVTNTKPRTERLSNRYSR
jgi:cold-inducible RNA-binding protein